jgi:hypothetical protein
VEPGTGAGAGATSSLGAWVGAASGVGVWEGVADSGFPLWPGVAAAAVCAGATVICGGPGLGRWRWRWGCAQPAARGRRHINNRAAFMRNASGTERGALRHHSNRVMQPFS